MSKEKDNIIQALDNIAITFDELGFEPTTANGKNYEHFNEWFLSEIETIKSNAIKQEQQIDQLKQQIIEKDKEIEDLKEWQDWYSMWHNKFKKQIEDLTTELETYRPTKLHGNGQCECYNCKQEGNQPIHWTDWCYSYKGHIYCDDCLKEILKEEQTSQIQLAIQELEKVKNLAVVLLDGFCHSIHYSQKEFRGHRYVDFYDLIRGIDNQIKELKGE